VAVEASDVPRSEAAPPARGGFDSYFKLTERGTTIGREVRAGLATFMVMVYIVFVNANILGAAGLDPAGVAAGTALVAGLLSILMGLVANFPIALAAGLGINGAVAFGLVLGQGLSPAGAMGVIVLEGLVVLLLVVVGLREAVMNAVPLSLKRAIGVGIGLFILFIGLVDAGLIINAPDASGPVPVQFVFPDSAQLGVFLLGLLLTIVLYVRKVPGALIISIFATAVIAFLTGVTQAPESFEIAPNFSTLGQFDVTEVFTAFGATAAILTIFAFMLTDFFDTMGTATGIAEQAGLAEQDGKIPGIGRLLLVDSLAAAAGGAAGVSSNTSYIESAAGVAEGGRTGLTAVIVGMLFLVAIIISPLAPLIPFVATGPVLVLVGYLMATMLKDIDFVNVEDGLPALLTLILMPLTFSITNGIGAGFIVWVLIKVALGKFSEIHWLMWLVSLAFVIYFAQALLPGGIFA
jgi:adenine/guanine/hypoxanthine permease